MSRSKKETESKFVSKHFTNAEIINLHNGLSKCGDISGSAKFSYAVARTQSLLEPIKKAIEKTNEAAKEYKTYEADRGKLIKDFTVKEDNQIINDVKFNGYNYDVKLTDPDKFSKKAKALESKNQSVIDARKKQISEYFEFLEEKPEEEISIHKLKYEDLPEDITLEQAYYSSFLMDIPIKDVQTKEIKMLDVLSIMLILSSLGDVDNEVFVDKMMFNLRVLKSIRDEQIFTNDIIKAYQKYNKELDELKDSLCGKNNMGQPAKSQLRSGTIIYHYEDLSEANSKILEFEEKNQKVIDDYKEFLDSKVKGEFKLLSWDDLPEDITSSKMKYLLPFIKE